MHIGCSDHYSTSTTLFCSSTGMEDLMIRTYEIDLGGHSSTQISKCQSFGAVYISAHKNNRVSLAGILCQRI
jgi:hypothetical protein